MTVIPGPDVVNVLGHDDKDVVVDPMEFCSCTMNDGWNPYEARNRSCPGSCEDAIRSGSFSQVHKNSTSPIPLMIMNTQMLIDINNKKKTNTDNKDLLDPEVHPMCWEQTSYMQKMTNALSHGGSIIEKKKRSLESIVNITNIHGTIHVRLGDYGKHCGPPLRGWDGCYPFLGWETWYQQILRACTAIGVMADDDDDETTCRVFVGTEGDISGLAALGCSGSPRIEFVCEGCASNNTECLTIIPFEPFSLHATNTIELEHVLGFGLNQVQRAVSWINCFYNHGRGFFIGNYYSSFSSMVFRMRFAESLRVGTFNTSTSLNAVWAPYRSTVFRWPKITESSSTCKAWPNRFDLFSKESDLKYIAALKRMEEEDQLN